MHLSLVWAGDLAFLAQLGGNKGGRIPEVTFQWAGGRGAAESHLFEGNIPVGRGPRRLVDLPFPNLNLTKAKEQGGVCVLASTMLGLVPDTVAGAGGKKKRASPRSDQLCERGNEERENRL